jgi:hypothetical protein
MVLMMMHGAERSPSRKPRRVLPGAERRLRATFPEVWAWYELLVAARGATPSTRVVDEPEDALQRTSARR